MIRARTIIFSGLILMAAGCSKSNFLIGKWKLAPDANPACAALDGVEFTDTTMTMDVMGKQTANVTYTNSGDNWSVTAPSGIITFEKNDQGIKSTSPFDCQLVPVS